MTLDHAALRKATQQLPSSIPSWLEVGQFAYWKEENCLVKILGYIGNIIRIEKNGETFSVGLEQLAQKEEFNQGLHDLSAIAHSPFRDLALQYLDDLARFKIIPGTQPDLRPLPQSMHPALQSALRQSGVEQFYSHQLQAWKELEQGNPITLVTETASGKTNCFLPQAFQGALKERKTTLLLYPLKALCSDQCDKLVTLNECLPEPMRLKIAKCTGDVPIEQRKAYFQGTRCPDIILASPDVLHHLLYRTPDGKYELWREFLRRLHLVVIDEAHAYLSSFGIHFANLMRRLRLASHYAGASHQVNWVVSTATIANPTELASQFTGFKETEITLIDRSGARRHDRTLLTFTPQTAPNYLVANLIQSLSQLSLKGLIFVNSRRTAKAIYNLVHAHSNGLANIDLFHGSLLPTKRRELIDRLGQGYLSTLISTSCLEAGIDLAALDYVVIRGIPSLNSFWQRAGRCGRSAPGLILFIPDNSNPIDFYYAMDSDRLLNQPEKVILNADYPSILARHLLCAGTEGGLHSRTVRNFFGEKGEAIATELVRQRQLYLLDNGKLSKRGYPHKDVSLRGIAQENVELIDRSTGEVLEEMSLSFAHWECHTGAIYISGDNGVLQRWRCLEFDEANRKAYLELLDKSDRLTRPQIELSVKPAKQLEKARVIHTLITEANLRISLWWGQVKQHINGYSEIVQKYAPVCTDYSCPRYNQPQVISQVNCQVCGQKLVKKLTDKVIEEITFPQSLSSGYDSPILRIEVNEKLASILYVEAEKERKRLKQKYETIKDIPSAMMTVFNCNPVHLALHSISHSLIKAIPLLFLASKDDVNSLVLERETKGESNANRFVAYLFDTVHEGCGTTEALYEDWEGAIKGAISLLSNCDCGEVGCPKCLSDHQCPEGNEALFKPLGVWLLKQCLC